VPLAPVQLRQLRLSSSDILSIVPNVLLQGLLELDGREDELLKYARFSFWVLAKMLQASGRMVYLRFVVGLPSTAMSADSFPAF